METNALIADILANTKTIALIGASANQTRPSHGVMQYMQGQGFRVIPVNPGLAGQKLHDEKVYASLLDIPYKIDLVDVFRRSEECPSLATQAASIGAQTLWLQLGVISQQAIDIATSYQMQAIQDRCLKTEYAKYKRAR